MKRKTGADESAPAFSPGLITADAIYTLAEFQKRTGFTISAMRAARRAGLRVTYRHKRAFVLGADAVRYLSESDESEES